MRSVEWVDGRVRLIDQKKIPWDKDTILYDDYNAVADAIIDMTVRGAPAIGATAAFGMALAANQSNATDMPTLVADLRKAAEILKASRPTAVNLMWAVDKIMELVEIGEFKNPDDLRTAILAAAQKIADDDVEINKAIGRYGAELIQDGYTVLHHCNTGSLATVDYGTALGVIRSAYEQGKSFHVLLDETRPRLQGSRLSAWELEQLGQPYNIIPDTAAGFYMRRGEIKMVVVGADRVAANGDFANKIGTYQIAVLAKENGIPFYCASPISTIDLNLKSGDEIPIEERSLDEVRKPYGNPLVPDYFKARNPAFDVTPHRYVAGFITEKGVIRPPYLETLAKAVHGE